MDDARAAGDVRAIAISHPHYFTTMVDWSRALGDVPVYVHEDDAGGSRGPTRAWSCGGGEELDLGRGVTLLRLGGHFAGGQVFHAGRSLLVGDIVQVVMDRRWVSFMCSYPNLIPLPAGTVLRMVEKLEPYEFDRVYGAWWDRVMTEGGKGAVRRSAERYASALEGQPSPSQ